MSNMIEQMRVRAGYRSNDALAVAILMRAPELESQIKTRSLGTRIGKLSRGETDWWVKNGKALDVLKELLSVDDAELGIHTGKTEYLFAFEEFPELPALDLRKESACEIGYGSVEEAYPQSESEHSQKRLDLEPWMSERGASDWRFRPTGCTWLHVPRGLGASLLIAKLKAISSYEVLEVSSIHDAEHRLKTPNPLILVITSNLDEESLSLLQGESDSALLVIAPMAFPSERESVFSMPRLEWEFNQLPKEEGARRWRTHPLWGIGVSRWTLTNGWRQMLLKWIHSRLESKGIDTLFDEQEAGRWLEKFDPDEQIIRTPSDLMSLSRVFHLRSKKSRPDATGRSPSRQLQSALWTHDSRIVDAFNQLAEAYWRSIHLPWGRELTWGKWRELGRLCGNRTDEASSKMRRKSSREEAQGNKASKSKSGTEAQLDALLKKRLLVEVPGTEFGDYALSPQLQADLHVRTLLADEIRAGDYKSWGKAALDPDRQYLIDSVLHAAHVTDLLSTVRALQEADPWDPAVIGASESLFLELGNRQANDAELPPEMIWVVEMVLKRYGDAGCEEKKLLLSRSSSLESDHADTLKLISACLGWSLGHKPRTAKKVDSLVLQMFAGWGGKQAVLPRMPEYPRESSWREFSSLEISPKWRAFLKAVLNVLLRSGGLTIHQEDRSSIVGSTLQMTVSLLSGEPLDPSWMFKVLKHAWAVKFVGERLREKSSPAVSRRTIEGILDSAYEQLSQTEMWYFDALTLFRNDLWRWAIGSTRPDQIFPLTSAKHRTVLRELPWVLPGEYRYVFLSKLPVGILNENERLISSVGDDAREILIQRLDAVEGKVSAKRLWELDDETTYSLLVSNRLSVAAQQNLVLASPAHMALKISKYLLTMSGVLDKGERRDWVIGRVGVNAANAAELFALLR